MRKQQAHCACAIRSSPACVAHALIALLRAARIMPHTLEANMEALVFSLSLIVGFVLALAPTVAARSFD